MEIDETSYSLGIQIEGYIRKEYENNFQNLKQANSLEESLESIRVMFKYLGKSHPNHGKGVDWARDAIEAYRTLGNIFDSMYSKLKLDKEEIEIGKSQIEEIARNYKNLLKDFGEEDSKDNERINDALKYLKELDEIMTNYDLTNSEELRERLEDLKEKEEINLHDKLENFEEEFS